MPADAPLPVVETVTQRGDSCITTPPLVFRNIALRITLKPMDAGRDFEPITFIKVFPAVSSTGSSDGGQYAIVDGFLDMSFDVDAF